MASNQILIRRIVAIDSILLLIFIDQLSKWWVIERYFGLRFFNTPATQDFIPWLITHPQERLAFYSSEITSFFNLVMVWNKGVSFGMFSTNHDFMPFVLMGFALLLCGVFCVWLWRATSTLVIASLSLIIAGAISNVWDRIRFGAVADFLDLHIGGWHWPAFNIADSCIVIGVAGLAFYTLILEPKIKQAQL